ncbi:MAG TPA: hypothetical protein VGQ46_19420 [Thermoanaerobaculia bacterium]|nr:hypothetical protein [Thermoanaerobaculia bacterium]
MNNDDVVALWQAQNSGGFRMSSDDIRSRMALMNRKLRRRTFDGYLVCATLILFFGCWMIVGLNTLQMTGAVLTICGVGYLAWQIRDNRFRALPVDASDTVEHFRCELARQRDFHRGLRFWLRLLVFVPGPLVFFAGFAQAHPEVAGIIRFQTITFAVLATAAIPLNLWIARRYQRQIDALARLQEEQ